MTDNGSCYKSFVRCSASIQLGIKHIRTKPHISKTGGKTERIIPSSLRTQAREPRNSHTGYTLAISTGPTPG
jgi:hypothetical protein